MSEDSITVDKNASVGMIEEVEVVMDMKSESVVKSHPLKNGTQQKSLGKI